MKIFECLQGSTEWLELHRGVPTASGFDRIMTAVTMKPSSQSEDFINDLIAQKAGAPMGGGYTSKAMADGLQCEPEARRWYEMERNADVRQVGFCVSDCGRFGCSPDGLVGDDGGLEIKCPQLKTQVGYLRNGGWIPQEYKPQVHGNLIVTGRAWWDFLSYAPGLSPILVRVYHDAYTDNLRKMLDEFLVRYQVASKMLLES